MPRDHQEIDERSRALHRLVAAKIRRDPRLLEVPRRNLARWRLDATPGDLRYLDAWQRLLDAGLDACLAAATEDSEHADALRQASPFAGVLTPRERAEFLASWRRQHAA